MPSKIIREPSHLKKMMPKKNKHNNKPSTTGFYRYQLAVPQVIFATLKEVAKDQDVTIVDLLRDYIKIGLWVSKVSKDPTTELILRKGGKETQLLLL